MAVSQSVIGQSQRRTADDGNLDSSVFLEAREKGRGNSQRAAMKHFNHTRDRLCAFDCFHTVLR